ncbi:hypothetical protein BDN70DRAFT_874258 [Pholiota conissans]|uniref:C3H1-type domain-containing protein n=1 Tax=Pholiota conissans TaxID=109636 RepID=A0A9P5Z7T7_9AGAR|nr:hypothetical protein BDN70DRAFT_874258 [Pholiota conissans]
MSASRGPPAAKPGPPVKVKYERHPNRRRNAPHGIPNTKTIPTPSEIRQLAKECVIRDTRGFAPTALLDTAREAVRAGEEHEVGGAVREAFAAYVKAVALAKMVLEAPEARDGNGRVREELYFFLKYDGAGINGRVKTLKEKLEAPVKNDKGKSKEIQAPATVQIQSRMGAFQDGARSDSPAEETASDLPTDKTSPRYLDGSDYVAPTAGSSQVNGTAAVEASSIPTSPRSQASRSTPSTPTTAKKDEIYSVLNFPVKSAVCKYWKRNGRCLNGSRCRLSHDLQTKPPEMQGTAVSAPSTASKDQGGTKRDQRRNRNNKQASVTPNQAEIQRRAEVERLEKERQAWENEERRLRAEEEEMLRKERAEKEEREARERVEKERLERERKAKDERLMKERNERERKEREERRQKARERQEREEREERERKEEEERERKAIEEREAMEQRDREEREQRKETQRQLWEAQKLKAQARWAQIQEERRLQQEAEARAYEVAQQAWLEQEALRLKAEEDKKRKEARLQRIKDMAAAEAAKKERREREIAAQRERERYEAARKDSERRETERKERETAARIERAERDLQTYLGLLGVAPPVPEKVPSTQSMITGFPYQGSSQGSRTYTAQGVTATAQARVQATTATTTATATATAQQKSAGEDDKWCVVA